MDVRDPQQHVGMLSADVATGPVVPSWSQDEVCDWVKQIGFTEFVERFVCNRVDGDMLLQMTPENMRKSIGINSELTLKRFMREVDDLKRLADYGSADSTNLNSFLQSIGPEMSVYTYSMLKAGVDMSTISMLSEDQLTYECGISNSIHRRKILNSIINLTTFMEIDFTDENENDKFDVFICYRHSTGSQFASFLQVKLESLRYSVFIDVKCLGAGNHDDNLQRIIKRAKNFLLVLTPNTLDGCVGDSENKDRMHKEIAAAIRHNCNVIPVLDDFQWPDANALPEDVRTVKNLEGVTWAHDYQDACVDRLEQLLGRDETENLWFRSPRVVSGNVGPTGTRRAKFSFPSRSPPETIRLSAPDTSLSRRRNSKMSVRNASRRDQDRKDDLSEFDTSKKGCSNINPSWKTLTNSNNHDKRENRIKSLDRQSKLDPSVKKINIVGSDYLWRSKSMYDLINERINKIPLLEKCQNRIKSVLNLIKKTF